MVSADAATFQVLHRPRRLTDTTEERHTNGLRLSARLPLPKPRHATVMALLVGSVWNPLNSSSTASSCAQVLTPQRHAGHAASLNHHQEDR